MESRSSAWNTIRESDCVALLFPGIRCEFLRLPCPEFPGVLFKLPEDEFSMTSESAMANFAASPARTRISIECSPPPGF